MLSTKATAQVITLVSGTADEIAVSVGDSVQAGDLLCRIDDESARLALQNARAAYQTALSGVGTAEAAVRGAESQYQSALESYGGEPWDETRSLSVLEEQVRLARENYDNMTAMLEIGATSQVEVDQAHSAMRQAEAGLAAAQSALNAAQSGVEQANSAAQQAQSGAAQAQVGVESAEYQLTLYHLTAPISGIVESINVTENNFTGSGTPAFVISNGRNKTVTFYITDQVRQNMALGQVVTVSLGERAYTGAITEVSGVVDAQTGQFNVKAIINEAQDLPDGLAVELRTTAYFENGAVIIPNDAVYYDNGAAYVFVAEDGMARRRDVTVSLYTAESAAVTNGLRKGDQVIVSWSADLRDGSVIRLAEETAYE